MTAGRRILIVEDDPYTRDLIGTALRQLGYDVTGAARFAQGIEAARASRPHLLICDVVLPDGSGVELVQTLREELPAAQRPVVVLMSAFSKGRLADQRAMKEATGAVAFLGKPVAVPQLLNLVTRHLPLASEGGANGASAGTREARTEPAIRPEPASLPETPQPAARPDAAQPGRRTEAPSPPPAPAVRGSTSAAVPAPPAAARPDRRPAAPLAASSPVQSAPRHRSAPGPQPAPAPDDRQAAETAAARLLEAEAAFDAGRRAAEQGDLAAAQAALERAVTLCPNEGEYVAWAAWVRALAARAVFDRTLDKTIAELEAAARLSPSCEAIFELVERVLRLRGWQGDAEGH